MEIPHLLNWAKAIRSQPNELAPSDLRIIAKHLEQADRDIRRLKKALADIHFRSRPDER